MSIDTQRPPQSSIEELEEMAQLPSPEVTANLGSTAIDTSTHFHDRERNIITLLSSGVSTTTTDPQRYLGPPGAREYDSKHQNG
mgnify:CR=1 FL=1|jgi:hypothetical protein